MVLVCLKSIPLLLLSFVLVLTASGCGEPASTSSSATHQDNRELSVFAGSASKPPLDELATLFEKQTGIKVYLTYGGSGSVLSQMKLAKTGDVYIPGSPDYLEKALKENVVDAGSSRIVAYLIPAINVQHGNPKNIQTLSDLAKPDIKIGIGNPNTVCVGLYAVELLDYNGVLAEVNSNIVTQADSCDKTATLLSLKSVDAVIGWDVFGAWAPESIDTIYLKPEQIPRLAYIPAAMSVYTKNKKNSQDFIDFLSSETGQSVFKKWGYNGTESEARTYAPQAKIGGEYQIPEAYKDLNQ